MSTSQQTRCPFCQSSFRVTEAQLSAKSGNVRCGSCLQVFRADLYLIKKATQSVDASQTRTPPKKANPDAAMVKMSASSNPVQAKTEKSSPRIHLPIPEQPSSDEFGFDVDDISDFLESDTPKSIGKPSKPASPFGDELNELLNDIEPFEFGVKTEDPHQGDESWAEDLLAEVNPTHSMTQELSIDGLERKLPKNEKLAAALGLTGEMRALQSQDDDSFTVADTSRVTTGRTNASMPRLHTGKTNANMGSFSPNKSSASIPSVNKTNAAMRALGNTSTGLPIHKSSTSIPVSSNPFSMDRPLSHIEAPVELKSKKESVNWAYISVWGSLSFLAITLLLIQFVFFNLESLATKDSPRSIMEAICNTFGCELPVARDASQLQVELVLRPHPSIANALQIDAILRNKAPFAQPMPHLKLSFSNLQDVLVASRELKPLDYLQGDARLMRRIQANSSIRLAIEIQAPKAEAVNYSLTPIF